MTGKQRAKKSESPVAVAGRVVAERNPFAAVTEELPK